MFVCLFYVKINVDDKSNSSNTENVGSIIQGGSSSGGTSPIDLNEPQKKEEVENPPPPPPPSVSNVNQGYAGFISSFFGGGNYYKQESNQQSSSKAATPSSAPDSRTTTHSPSPGKNVVQTFSPTLQVPLSNVDETAKSGDSVSKSPVGFVHSTGSPFQQAAGSKSTLPPSTISNTSLQNPPSQFVNSANWCPPPPLPSQVPNPSRMPNPNQLSNTQDVVNSQNQHFSYGFESFNDSKLRPSIGSLPKAQSSFDLPVRNSAESAISNHPSSFFNAPQTQGPNISGTYFYEGRPSSVDSLNYNEPASMGNTYPPPPPLLNSSNASGPPISSSKYRIPIYIDPVVRIFNELIFFLIRYVVQKLSS